MLKQLLQKCYKDTQGATAIEFVIVAPVLFMLIFGIIEFGMIMASQSALESAATTAARAYKAQARSNQTVVNTTAIHQLVSRYGMPLVKPAEVRVVARRLGGWGGAASGGNPDESSGNAGRTGQIIQYRIFYNYQVMTPFLSGLIGNNGKLRLMASTVMQNEPAIGVGGL